MAKKTVTKAAAREAARILDQIERLREHVERLEVAASGSAAWSAVGSLDHISKTLSDLLGDEE